MDGTKHYWPKQYFFMGSRMDGCHQFLFFSYIHFVMEILWRPLVAGERIGKMDGWKILKNWFEKKTQFCYQLLSVVIKSCYQLLSCK